MERRILVCRVGCCLQYQQQAVPNTNILHFGEIPDIYFEKDIKHINMFHQQNGDIFNAQANCTYSCPFALICFKEVKCRGKCQNLSKECM
jgi:hypothetical protein